MSVGRRAGCHWKTGADRVVLQTGGGTKGFGMTKETGS